MFSRIALGAAAVTAAALSLGGLTAGAASAATPATVCGINSCYRVQAIGEGASQTAAYDAAVEIMIKEGCDLIAVLTNVYTPLSPSGWEDHATGLCQASPVPLAGRPAPRGGDR
jgi:hypothetical protein